MNKQLYSSVDIRTVRHHVRNPWELEIKERTFYFCNDPDCDVVYFADDDSVVTQNDLRTEIGTKSGSDESLLCYCFGVSKADASRQEIKDFVIEQTRLGLCSCETSNPSGRCCLKDFPRSR